MTNIEAACGLLSLAAGGSLILAVVAGLSRDRWKQRYQEMEKRYFDVLTINGYRRTVHPRGNVVEFRRRPKEPTGL